MRASVPALSLFAALALAAATLPLAANAFPVIPAPQPAGAGCTAVKIVSANPALSWAVMNCNNNLAYMIVNKTTLVTLAPPCAGWTSERVYDVALKGISVGTVTCPAAPFVRAVQWNAAGAPVVLGLGVAAGIDQFDQPIVGFRKVGALQRAFWYRPGPHFIGPVPVAPGSFAYDINRQGVIVGQLNNVAAAGGGALASLGAMLAGTTKSVAYAINEPSLIVGHADFPGGGCNGGPPGVGFILPWPGGPAAAFGPLGGDCSAGAEDDNDTASVVGYSLPPAGLPQAIAQNLPGPFPPGLIALNALGGPWVSLTDAPGVDNANTVIATDGGAAPTHVYFLN